MERYAPMLRQVAESAGLPSVKRLAAQPGMKAVYRVTAHYPDFHACDSVATLICFVTGEPSLEAIYSGHFNHKPLKRRLNDIAVQGFTRVMSKAGFDKLADQKEAFNPSAGVCMVERGAGRFVKSVIFCIQSREWAHAHILDAVQIYMPEALREIVT